MLHDTRNSVDYFLRSRLGWSRRLFRERGIDLRRQMESLTPEDAALVSRLVWRYGMEPYFPFLGKHSFFDNLMHLLLLDHLWHDLPRVRMRRILDVGSKNFAYALSLFEYFRKFHQESGCIQPADLEIIGVEIDANRVYRNLYSRKEAASYYTGLVAGARYMEGDFLKIEFSEPMDVILHFFPFIELSSLLDYGLPSRFFKPLEMFRASYHLLSPNGILMMANTTRDEYLHGKSLLEACQFLFLKAYEVRTGGFIAKPLYVSMFMK